MTTKSLLDKVYAEKTGDMPVVVLPLKTWQAIEEKLEEFDMMNTPVLKKEISRARKEKKLYSASEAKRMLVA